MSLTKSELIKIHELLNMLRIKSKTDFLYKSVVDGMKLIERELKLKEIENSYKS